MSVFYMGLVIGEIYFYLFLHTTGRCQRSKVLIQTFYKLYNWIPLIAGVKDRCSTER